MTKKKTRSTTELLVGVHALIELLRAKKRKLVTVYTTRPEPKAWKQIQQVWPKYPVAIQYVNRDVLTRMVDTPDHQSIVAWVQPFPFRKKPFDSTKQPFIVLLDGVQDPRNLGAILRSAYCTNVDGVVLVQRGAAPLSPIALKASAGLAEHLQIYRAPSTAAAVQEIKTAGYHLCLATVGEGTPVMQADFQLPLCVVIGSEGAGISRQIREAGTKITIPERQPAGSYNASVAAGILLFTIASRTGRLA